VKTLVIQPKAFEFGDEHMRRLGLQLGGPILSVPYSTRRVAWRQVSKAVGEATGLGLPEWDNAGRITLLGDEPREVRCEPAGLNALLAEMKKGRALSTVLRQVLRNRSVRAY
jgi:hypothetical protein